MITIAIILCAVCALIAAFVAYRCTKFYYTNIGLADTPQWVVKWIPVEKRLPRIGKSVLVAYRLPDSDRIKVTFSRRSEDGAFYIEKAGTVIAWAMRPAYVPNKYEK